MDACNYVDFPALHGSYCRSSYSKLRVLHAVGPCRKPAVPVDHTKLLCMIRIISTTLISPLTQSSKNKTVSGVSEMLRLRREEAERPAGKEGKIGGRGGDCMRMDEQEQPAPVGFAASDVNTHKLQTGAGSENFAVSGKSAPQSILLMFVDHEIGRACVW